MTRKHRLAFAGAVLAASVLAPAPAPGDQNDARLDSLFAVLKQADGPAELAFAEQLIWRIWGIVTVTKAREPFEQGLLAMQQDRLEAAASLFTQVVAQAPDFAEGWNKRATVYFLLGDYAASAADVATTLKLEPRHFGALSGLGLINLALGRDRAALAAFEAALAVHPHLPGVQEHAKELRQKLGGKPT